eukprot:TRINITY_DN875_c0_g1_i1.p2 TRINITY_DN875_c0_g1~~TRINITY_DN875_c0_g1_i1.p2  ORF type:complete len:160 (+),score=39.31 TRINITY_DN875_c0_g1_i1:144-623(+)
MSACAKLCLAGCFLIGVGFIAVGILLPGVVDGVMKDQIKAQGTMTQDNVGLWGRIPGETKMFLRRDFYFFDLQNADEVLFSNATPRFIERGPFSYQEYQEFLDPKFDQDGNTVTGQMWQYYKPLSDGLDPETKVSTLSLGAGARGRDSGANTDRRAGDT